MPRMGQLLLLLCIFGETGQNHPMPCKLVTVHCSLTFTLPQPVQRLCLVFSFLYYCIPHYFKLEEYGSALASALFISLK